MRGGCRMQIRMEVKDKPQWVKKGCENADEEWTTVDAGMGRE